MYYPFTPHSGGRAVYIGRGRYCLFLGKGIPEPQI